MRVHLLTFASASDAVGASELEIELPDAANVEQLKSLLEERYPQLRSLWGRLAVAVAGEIVDNEARLQDGDEVALLPPVSGGLPESQVSLVEGPIDIRQVEARVRSPGRGAVVLFVGTVRDHHESRRVESIAYSAYRSMALRKLELIVKDLESQHADLRLAITHRLGSVGVGEASVAIAAASPHRAEAYEASRVTLERLKTEVPIWKREHYQDGAVRWREEESLRALTPELPGD